MITEGMPAGWLTAPDGWEAIRMREMKRPLVLESELAGGLVALVRDDVMAEEVHRFGVPAFTADDIRSLAEVQEDSYRKAAVKLTAEHKRELGGRFIRCATA
jgi:class 3 adenylate cyclase